jgi:hypothetical protein
MHLNAVPRRTLAASARQATPQRLVDDVLERFARSMGFFLEHSSHV